MTGAVGGDFRRQQPWLLDGAFGRYKGRGSRRTPKHQLKEFCHNGRGEIGRHVKEQEGAVATGRHEGEQV